MNRGVRYPRVLPAGAVALLLVIIAIVAGRDREFRPAEVAGSPEPTSTAGAVVPTGTPSSQPGEALLVVNTGGHGIGIRTEADPTVFFRVENRTQYAVRGSQLAYWKTGPDDALPHELHVYDATARSDRAVLTLTEERAGAAGFMVWSSDGQGLAIAVHNKESAFEGRFSPARPTSSSWRLVDLTTGRSRTIGVISGAWLVPVSWDRSAGIATATELERDSSGSPVRAFYEFSEAAMAMQQLPLPAPLEPLSIVADPAAQVAIGIENRQCGELACRVLWHWRLTDVYGASSRVTPELLVYAAFRPGTADVYVLLRKERTESAPYRIEDWGSSEATPVPPRIVISTAPDFFFFRTDGSALIALNSALDDKRARIVEPTGATLSEFAFSISNFPMAALGGSAPTARLPSVFPQNWLLVGTEDGRVFRGLVPFGGAIPPMTQSWKVCDAAVRRIVAAPGSSRVLVICGEVAGDQNGFLIDADLLAGSDPPRVRAIPGPMSTNVAWSRDRRSLIYTSRGSCEPPAPICKERLWLRELTNGEPIDAPRLLLEEYNLGAVNWTPLGPSVFKPQMSLNGIRQPADAGTFLYDGSAWRRYSLHEVLDAIRDGPTLLAAEGGSASRRGGGVVIRVGTQETRWTPADVNDETPLALLDDGRVLAWRPLTGPFRGQLVVYRDGLVVSSTMGAFSAFATFRAGIFGEWVLGQEFSGAPTLTLHSYSISARAFAPIQPGLATTAVGASLSGPRGADEARAPSGVAASSGAMSFTAMMTDRRKPAAAGSDEDRPGSEPRFGVQ